MPFTVGRQVFSIQFKSSSDHVSVDIVGRNFESEIEGGRLRVDMLELVLSAANALPSSSSDFLSGAESTTCMLSRDHEWQLVYYPTKECGPKAPSVMTLHGGCNTTRVSIRRLFFT